MVIKKTNNGREYDDDFLNTFYRILNLHLGNEWELGFNVIRFNEWLDEDGICIPDFEDRKRAVSMRLLRINRMGYLRRKIVNKKKYKIIYFFNQDHKKKLEKYLEFLKKQGENKRTELKKKEEPKTQVVIEQNLLVGEI